MPNSPTQRQRKTENAYFTTIPTDGGADKALSLMPRRAGRLATPPPGSGLRPVMGNAGTVPFIGDTIQWLRYGPAFHLDNYERFGAVSWFSALGVKIVALVGGEAIGALLTNRDKAFATGHEDFAGKFFPGGLLMLNFDEHLVDRRIMQQAFTPMRLRGYFSKITTHVDDAVAGWPDSQRIELHDAIKKVSLDIGARVFLGTDVGPESERLSRAFNDAVLATVAIVRFPLPGNQWQAGLRGRKLLEQYVTRMLPEKRVSQETDFFSVLCQIVTEEGERFSNQKIIDHMIFLLLAAHDTSSTTAANAAYYLGKHPEWQHRARAESLALGDGPLDIDALANLETLDLVIKEALRIVLPVPSMMRKAVRDTEILGHYIPEGTYVLMAGWANHFLSEYWTDPAKFDPERFNDERREDKSHRLAWMPFGAGVHKCIGMHFGTLEVKAILHAMLLNYTWELPPDYEIPWAYTALPEPKDGLPVVLHRR